jgi:glycerophosphoryl diester phosphodiesterase
MYQQLPRPTIFAHRGSSLYAPENTLAAFELAISQNADAIELDAKLCADGEVIVFHDQTVERTSDGSGNVLDLPLAALKELDAGSWFNTQFRNEVIPTLGEVFELMGRKVFINIELTNYASPRDDLPDKVAELVLRYGLQNSVLFSSFNPMALRRIHRHIPDVPLGLLALPGFWGAWARSCLGKWVPYQALHPAVGDTSLKLIQKQHQRGYRVYVWTVNTPVKMQQLFEWEVDGIFTDDPPLAQQLREQAAT